MTEAIISCCYCAATHQTMALLCVALCVSYAYCCTHPIFLQSPHLAVHVYDVIVCAASLFCHADTLLSHCCQVWALCALTPVVSNLCLILRCVCVSLLGACAAGARRERGEIGTPAWLHSPLATYQLWAHSASFSPHIPLSLSAHTSCGRRTNQNALIQTQYVTNNWSFFSHAVPHCFPDTGMNLGPFPWKRSVCSGSLTDTERSIS